MITFLKGGKMKRAILDATFPELPSGKMYKKARGMGGSSKVAIKRAVDDLFKQVKGKRITTFQVNVLLVDVSTCQICGFEVCRCCEKTNKEP